MQVRDELLRRHPLTVSEMDGLLEKQGLTLGALMRQERHRAHAESKPAPLSLAVGKWYLRRNGSKIQVVKRAPHLLHSYILSDDGTVAPDGRYDFAAPPHALDLIAETTAPDEEKKHPWVMKVEGCYVENSPTSVASPSAPLAVGDLVRLKSGGPVMTVARDSEVLDCEWFNGHGVYVMREFKRDMLVRAKL
jgi:uncharacterized protein YodC (DUF2158 family)